MAVVRDSPGQASLDYLAVLAVVALVLGVAAAAVGAPWLAPRVATAIRHGVCVVSGALCTPGEAREAGHLPCPIHRRSDAERLGAVALIRLERGDALLVERRSDGTASVSFVDGGRAGVEAGIGVTLPAAAGSAHAGIGLRFAAGRTYDFGEWGAAKRFLASFAREETLTGEGRRVLRTLCWRCPEWIEGRSRDLPAPAARYLEGGSFVDFAAQLGVRMPVLGSRSGVGLDAQGGRAAVVGRRTAGRQVTWYVRLEAEVVATLGAVMGSIHGGRRAEGVLEVTTEAGEPVRARVRATAGIAGEAELAGLRTNVAGVADRLRGATARADERGGLELEAAVTLDLRDPANLRAFRALLHPGTSPLGWLERARAMGRRLDVAGVVDLTVVRVGRDSTDHTAQVGELVRFGGGYGRVTETRDLVSAWGLTPERGLRRREDCAAA